MTTTTGAVLLGTAELAADLGAWAMPTASMTTS
jgi:hypothetical protein